MDMALDLFVYQCVCGAVCVPLGAQVCVHAYTVFVHMWRVCVCQSIRQLQTMLKSEITHQL